MAFRCARDSCKPAFLIWTSASALTFASSGNAQPIFEKREKTGLQIMYTPAPPQVERSDLVGCRCAAAASLSDLAGGAAWHWSYLSIGLQARSRLPGTPKVVMRQGPGLLIMGPLPLYGCHHCCFPQACAYQHTGGDHFPW